MTVSMAYFIVQLKGAYSIIKINQKIQSGKPWNFYVYYYFLLLCLVLIYQSLSPIQYCRAQRGSTTQVIAFRYYKRSKQVCMYACAYMNISFERFSFAETVQILEKLLNTAGNFNVSILHGGLDSFYTGSCQMPINVHFTAVYFLYTKNWDIFVTLKHSPFLTLIPFA